MCKNDFVTNPTFVAVAKPEIRVNTSRKIHGLNVEILKLSAAAGVLTIAS